MGTQIPAPLVGVRVGGDDEPSAWPSAWHVAVLRRVAIVIVSAF